MDQTQQLCTICARGGSQGVKNKNIRLLSGRPLIAWTVRQALSSNCFDQVVVSSDSADILEAAKAAGATLLIKRADHLATNGAGKVPAIRNALQEAEQKLQKSFPILMDLDCTSPLRSVEDIQQALAQFYKSRAPVLVSGTHSRRSPYFNLIERDVSGQWGVSKKMPIPLVRRQDAPQTYDMNASIYIWKREVLMSENSLFLPGTELYVMPEERSYDIDSELDFKIVQRIADERDDFR